MCATSNFRPNTSRHLTSRLYTCLVASSHSGTERVLEICGETRDDMLEDKDRLVHPEKLCGCVAARDELDALT